MSEVPTHIEILLRLFNEQGSSINTLWGLLSAVALALLGFVYKESGIRGNFVALVALTIGFVVFAIGNQNAMARSQRVIHEVAAELQGASSDTSLPIRLRSVLARFEARDETTMRIGHSTMILCVVVGVWVPFVLVKQGAA